jgi:disulfide bond formation protein DsbB
MTVSNRQVFALIAVAALGLLAGGLAIGEIERLHPCYLCNFQRLLYILVGVFALCGVLLPGWRRLWGALVGATAIYGAVIAIQQSWMQYAPQQATECGFGDPTFVERVVNWLSGQWPAMFMVTGMCTNKEWIFLKLSLANWSAVCFVILSVLALWLLFRRTR